MQLDKPVTIIPPSYILNNQVIHPNPFVLKELDITYTDNPKDKRVYLTIKPFPIGVQLWGPESYDAVGDWTQKQAEDRLKALINNEIHKFLGLLFKQTGDTDPDGPGSILAGMFSGLGIKTSPTCSCKKHMREMNLRGNDWCENNMDTIMSWLRAESEKRKLPFVEIVAKTIVRSSIKKSRRLLEKRILANAQTR
jgi:hypothetical protein